MWLPTGVPAPIFSAPSPVNPHFNFHSLGGRYILLVFLPPPSREREAALQAFESRAALMRDDRLLVFGVLPDNESFQLVQQTENCVRWFYDGEGEIRRVYGATDAQGELQPGVVLIDPTLRIMGSAPLTQAGPVLEHVARLGAAENHAGVPMHAPVLIVPRVLERDFCQQLIQCYEKVGGEPSGVMQLRDGKTVGVFNDMKRRRDATIADGHLREHLRARLTHRLLPEIEKAFQFRATVVERYIVACYDAEEGGYFIPHRDNTSPGTAHRKFAVSINLNAADFEGGDLRFPEFGRRTYRPPTGGAVVFSCSLLHEATPVTKGRRYATLPFLYDEEGARVRAANLHTIVNP